MGISSRNIWKHRTSSTPPGAPTAVDSGFFEKLIYGGRLLIDKITGAAVHSIGAAYNERDALRYRARSYLGYTRSISRTPFSGIGNYLLQQSASFFQEFTSSSIAGNYLPTKTGFKNGFFVAEEMSEWFPSPIMTQGEDIFFGYAPDTERMFRAALSTLRNLPHYFLSDTELPLPGEIVRCHNNAPKLSSGIPSHILDWIRLYGPQLIHPYTKRLYRTEVAATAFLMAHADAYNEGSLSAISTRGRRIRVTNTAMASLSPTADRPDFYYDSIIGGWRFSGPLWLGAETLNTTFETDAVIADDGAVVGNAQSTESVTAEVQVVQSIDLSEYRLFNALRMLGIILYKGDELVLSAFYSESVSFDVFEYGCEYSLNEKKGSLEYVTMQGSRSFSANYYIARSIDYVTSTNIEHCYSPYDFRDGEYIRKVDAIFPCAKQPLIGISPTFDKEGDVYYVRVDTGGLTESARRSMAELYQTALVSVDGGLVDRDSVISAADSVVSSVANKATEDWKEHSGIVSIGDNTIIDVSGNLSLRANLSDLIGHTENHPAYNFGEMNQLYDKLKIKVVEAERDPDETDPFIVTYACRMDALDKNGETVASFEFTMSNDSLDVPICTIGTAMAGNYFEPTVDPGPSGKFYPVVPGCVVVGNILPLFRTHFKFDNLRVD